MGLEQLDSFMTSIRAIESGGGVLGRADYTIVNPKSGASGAYQFIDSTWANYKGFAHAKDAPPAIQDERAKQLMTSYFQSYGDWGVVAAAWHGGPKAAEAKVRTGSAGTSDGIMKTDDYAAKAVSLMSEKPKAGGTATSPTGQQAQGKLAVPKDATLYMVDGKTAFLVYDVGDGVKVRFDVNVSGTDLSGIRTQQIGGADFHRLQTVNGGDASELGSMAADFGSFGQWFDHIVQTIFPKNSPAIHDPQVRRVIGEIAARPDMSSAEIQNRLRGTTWYQGQSDQAQKYNQATDAEKLAMIGTTAADLASDWQENVGEPISPNDPRIMAMARDVATGKRGRGQVLYEDIIPIARQNPESPRARTERDEQKNQLQHGNDIENQKTQVIDSFHRWGVSGDNSVFGKWAQEIADGTKSAEDLRAYLQQTAQVLYPWKDPNTETLDAAQPWMSTYRRVLERDPAGLEDPILQQALNSGTPLYQFEKDLKGRSEWLYTKNAREDVEKTFSEVGSIMGFN